MLKSSPFERHFNRLSLPFIALLALFVVSTPLSASPSSQRASAEELLTLVNMPQQLKGMADQILNPIRARFSQIKTTQEKADVVRQHLGQLETAIYNAYSWDANKARFIDLYTKIYTEEELEDLVTFFSSPAGKKFLNPGPEFIQSVTTLNQENAKSLKPQIEAIQMNLKQALTDINSSESS
jgi:uncharacterized protein